jgi:predicted amidohydrolase
MKTLTVGGCRIPVTHNIVDNLAEIKKAIDWAAENSVDIMSTPECALSGYMWSPKSKEDPRVVELEDAIQLISDYSKEKKVDLVLGTAWYDTENQWTNTQAFIINGICEYTYRKNLLVYPEIEHYTMGHPPTIYKYKGVRIAGLICNDAWSNPMMWPGTSAHILNRLNAEGVEVVFLSAFVPKDCEPKDVFYRWHKSQIEMFSAFGNWTTVVCDSSTDIDSTAYDGASVCPIGVCDYNTRWIDNTKPGTVYFKSKVDIQS